ncbi:hormone-sensitive lipase-like, partial [Camarhynchus parvulus]|uniref:hormone-sensitive lipase-like n=1 Tax=Geospiza parvula TaxID=87175 RepID=UPI001237CB51
LGGAERPDAAGRGCLDPDSAALSALTRRTGLPEPRLGGAERPDAAGRGCLDPDSAALSALTRQDGAAWTPSPFPWRRGPPLPPSPGLLLHFHGGGFVAQTSRSHEPYLRGWARDLGTPILSVDYALAPEAPFPRALEECFYAYCWALRHCRMLGSPAERVCVAGDSAGGNLCLGVSLRAVALGVRVPQAVVAAYPVTLVRAAASPSRLLTLMDPLLPLGVLCQCLGAYAGTLGDGPRSPPPPRPAVGEGLLLRGLRGGAAWLGGLLRGRPPPKPEPAPNSEGGGAEDPPEDALEDPPKFLGYPEGFRPLRTGGPPAIFGEIPPKPPRDPFMSPLLAPDSLLGGLPPVHLVACALDPMLDDSVALARRLRALGRAVTLRVLPGVPHGFLSLAPLSPECRRAGALCSQILREVLEPPPQILPRLSLAGFGGSRRESLALAAGNLGGLGGSRRESLVGFGAGGSRRESLPPN